MGRTNKKKRKDNKNKKNRREKQERKPVDKDKLYLISTSDVWTPKMEDEWLEELSSQTTKEIYEKFPSGPKPRHVKLSGKRIGGG